MAKFVVLKPVKDKETGSVFKVGDIIDLNAKRAKEAASYIGEYLEKVTNKKDPKETE